MRDTFAKVHRRGGYFRLLGYGFLVNVSKHPLYGMRTHGHHVGPVWWRVLRPVPEGAQIDGKKCPSCGAENPAHLWMCWSCHTALIDGSGAGTQAPGSDPGSSYRGPHPDRSYRRDPAP